MCHNLGQAENGHRGGLYHVEADGGCDEREINKVFCLAYKLHINQSDNI